MDNEKTPSDVKSEHLATLHHESTNRASEISEKSGVKIPDDIASFVTETTFRFCQMLATDIESFARHAKRSTINTDDVLLFARRNPLLTKFLEDKSAEFDAAADAEDANSDIQPAKRKKLSTKSKLKDASGSNIKDSPLNSSPLKAFFIQPDKTAQKASNASNVRKTSVGSSTLNTSEKTSLQEKPSEIIHEPKSSTLTKDDTGEEAINSVHENSLFGDKDDFSNIFDDFDAL